jgi:hypothetical protein
MLLFPSIIILVGCVFTLYVGFGQYVRCKGFVRLY